MCPYFAEEVKESLDSLYQGESLYQDSLTSYILMTSWPPKGLASKYHRTVIFFSTYEFWGDTNIQSTMWGQIINKAVKMKKKYKKTKTKS